MPPVNDQNNYGWKAFFSLLMVLQVIAIGVMWRTYDTVTQTAKKVELHDYILKEHVLPKIK
jgi:hypothetical protein